MNRLIILALLFVSSLVHAQKDFDYTFYTSHMVIQGDSSGSPMNLTVYRKFQKEDNTLKVVSLVNTGDAVEYKLLYQGFRAFTTNGCELIYRVLSKDGVAGVEQMLFIINPITPLVIIQAGPHRTSYY